MKSLKTYIQTSEHYDDLIFEYVLLSTEENVLEESLNDMIKKTGLYIHKERGLIDYILKAGKTVGKLVVAAIKKDKKTIKSLMSDVEKSDVIDFLLKLDQATLHLVTGPIHFIDAVTGWFIWADVKSHMQSAEDAVKEFLASINRVKSQLEKLFKGDKKRAIEAKNHLDELEKYFTMAK